MDTESSRGPSEDTDGDDTNKATTASSTIRFCYIANTSLDALLQLGYDTPQYRFKCSLAHAPKVRARLLPTVSSDAPSTPRRTRSCSPATWATPKSRSSAARTRARKPTDAERETQATRWRLLFRQKGSFGGEGQRCPRSKTSFVVTPRSLVPYLSPSVCTMP